MCLKIVRPTSKIGENERDLPGGGVLRDNKATGYHAILAQPPDARSRGQAPLVFDGAPVKVTWSVSPPSASLFGLPSPVPRA